jgi:hypothetical protein
MKATVAPYSLPTYYHLPSTVRVVLNGVAGNVVQNDNTSRARRQKSINSLPAAEPDIHHLRDGDVVLLRVPRSKFWQARYKLLGGKWLRFSTRQRRRTCSEKNGYCLGGSSAHCWMCFDHEGYVSDVDFQS